LVAHRQTAGKKKRRAVFVCPTLKKKGPNTSSELMRGRVEAGGGWVLKGRKNGLKPRTLC